jgi:hypothetical protein
MKQKGRELFEGSSFSGPGNQELFYMFIQGPVKPQFLSESAKNP